MAHKKFIDSVMKHGQVTIKDLDEFLRFTLCDYDMRTIDDNYISILLPRQFDINKVFGLDVCKRSDDDYSMGFDAVTGYFNPEYRIFRP